jgi:hypothetical protein
VNCAINDVSLLNRLKVGKNEPRIGFDAHGISQPAIRGRHFARPLRHHANSRCVTILVHLDCAPMRHRERVGLFFRYPSLAKDRHMTPLPPRMIKDMTAAISHPRPLVLRSTRLGHTLHCPQCAG